MQDINWGLTAQAIVSLILFYLFVRFLYVPIVAWFGEKLLEADLRLQEEERERAEECRRLAIRVTTAELIESLPPKRRRLYREAESLGFLDSDDLPRREA